MKRRKVIKIAWIILSLIMITAMFMWTFSGILF